MTENVRVLIASCGSDFQERDVVIVSRTDEGGAKALLNVLMKRFDSKSPRDREFWHDDFDKYYADWDINLTGTRLES